MKPLFKRFGVVLTCVFLFGLFLLARRPAQPPAALSTQDHQVVAKSSPLPPPSSTSTVPSSVSVAPVALSPIPERKATATTTTDLARILEAIPDGPFRRSLQALDQTARTRALKKLARLKASRGESLIALGEKANGLQDLRAAQSLLETEIVRTDRADLKEFLTWLKSRIARLAR